MRFMQQDCVPWVWHAENTMGKVVTLQPTLYRTSAEIGLKDAVQ